MSSYYLVIVFCILGVIACIYEMYRIGRKWQNEEHPETFVDPEQELSEDFKNLEND